MLGLCFLNVVRAKYLLLPAFWWKGGGSRQWGRGRAVIKNQYSILSFWYDVHGQPTGVRGVVMVKVVMVKVVMVVVVVVVVGGGQRSITKS